MINCKSIQWILLSVDSENLLIGHLKSTVLSIYLNILNNFFWNFDLFDNLFNDLLNFCLFLHWPVIFQKLFYEYKLIFWVLWTNVIINASFWLEGLDHFPFSRLNLKMLNHWIHLFYSICSTTQKSCLLGYRNFLFDHFDWYKSLIIKLVELFVYFKVKWFLFYDGFDRIVTIFDLAGITTF